MNSLLKTFLGYTLTACAIIVVLAVMFAALLSWDADSSLTRVLTQAAGFGIVFVLLTIPLSAVWFGYLYLTHEEMDRLRMCRILFLGDKAYLSVLDDVDEDPELIVETGPVFTANLTREGLGEGIERIRRALAAEHLFDRPPRGEDDRDPALKVMGADRWESVERELDAVFILWWTKKHVLLGVLETGSRPTSIERLRENLARTEDVVLDDSVYTVNLYRKLPPTATTGEIADVILTAPRRSAPL